MCKTESPQQSGGERFNELRNCGSSFRAMGLRGRLARSRPREGRRGSPLMKHASSTDNTVLSFACGFHVQMNYFLAAFRSAANWARFIFAYSTSGGGGLHPPDGASREGGHRRISVMFGRGSFAGREPLARMV